MAKWKCVLLIGLWYTQFSEGWQGYTRVTDNTKYQYSTLFYTSTFIENIIRISWCITMLQCIIVHAATFSGHSARNHATPPGPHGTLRQQHEQLMILSRHNMTTRVYHLITVLTAAVQVAVCTCWNRCSCALLYSFVVCLSGWPVCDERAEKRPQRWP